MQEDELQRGVGCVALRFFPHRLDHTNVAFFTEGRAKDGIVSRFE